MNLGSFKTIAVLQTAFIGDTLLSLLFLDQIKLINPNCKILFISLEKYDSILKLSNSIDKLIYLDKKGKHKNLNNLITFSKSLRDYKIDLFISLHLSLRSTLIAKLSGANYSVSFKESAFSFLYSKTTKRLFHLHETEKNIELLKLFKDYNTWDIAKKNDIQNGYLKANLDLSLIPTDDIENILPNNTKKTVILSPGSVWETKKWGKEKFQALCKKLLKNNFNVFISGGDEDIELCKFIKDNSEAIITAGVFTLSQSLLLFTKADIIISNDSAPIHFGTLINIPTIAIYGPTDPIFGFYPLSQNSISVYTEKLDCRPCEIHGSNQCPLGTHKCMDIIETDLIIDKLELILKNKVSLN